MKHVLTDWSQNLDWSVMKTHKSQKIRQVQKNYFLRLVLKKRYFLGLVLKKCQFLGTGPGKGYFLGTSHVKMSFLVTDSEKRSFLEDWSWRKVIFWGLVQENNAFLQKFLGTSPKKYLFLMRKK